MSRMMKEFLGNSYLFGGNAPFIEELYERYLAEPGSRCRTRGARYFDQLQLLPGGARKDVAHAPVVESFAQRAKTRRARAAARRRPSAARRARSRSRRCS